MQKRNLIFIPTQLHDKQKLEEAFEDVMEKEKQLQKIRQNNFVKIFESTIS